MPQTLDAPAKQNGSIVHKGRSLAAHTFRRLSGTRPAKPETRNLLPLLIQVLAGFSKVDGRILEEEIDSSLGFLREYYPEAVYSELRASFQNALEETQDLSSLAK